MTQLQLITDLLIWGGGFLFWVSGAFPVVVSVIWPWWQSWWGRNIVSLDVAIALALLPSTLYHQFGVMPSTYLFGWITVGALFGAGIVVAWRTVLIFRTQLAEYRDAQLEEYRNQMEEHKNGDV